MGERQNLIARALDWLRAGYPTDVPPEDRVALLGILHRHLTDAEIEHVAQTLHAEHGSPYTADEIAVRIKEFAAQKATDDDVARVTARLGEARWTQGEAHGAAGEQGPVS